jgi:RimJ/RimL family protein N-acetyltransferase
VTIIESERLLLHPLPPSLVSLLAAGDWQAAAATDPPFDITESTFSDDEHVLLRRHAQLAEDPTQAPWLIRVAVLRGTRQVVGRAGFHAPPDGDGVVEIGYSVSPPWRRQGFGREMAQALLSWAGGQGCTACLASVRPDNTGSLAIVAGLGFVRIGEHIDEIDGLEWVHRLEFSDR